ncbi:MAG: aminotransferase class III-fold pyridoxal phosphate-dependent enzyme, partial [Dehalococcoidia bacterium]|nr:aminotransferase class III-fold pyridoxal phosphate-dependent enzyme [Dehalococcoidia bacterium]
QYGIEPDVMTLAKGLGGGVPIGALLAKERVSVFEPGEHGSTFGGNPLVCAAAVAVLKYIIENDIPARVKRLGEYFMLELIKLKQEFPFITSVRGRGLLLAMEFDSDIGDEITYACLERRLLVNRVKPNALRFIPPLIIKKKEIDEGLAILREVLKQWQAGRK